MNGLMSAIAFSAVLAGQPADARPAAQPCTITREVLKPYAAPATATQADFAASRAALVEVHTNRCTGKVWTAAEKRVLYEWLVQEMSLDWQSVFAAWGRRGQTVDADLAWEGPLHFQRQLLEDVANVTTSADLAYRDTLLRFADGNAIAKLGHAAYADVLAAAQRPALLVGLGRSRNPQEEAIRALGIWLDPDTPGFTAGEKADMARVLMGLLSDDLSYRSPVEYKMTNTLLRALAQSDSAEVAQRLSDWQKLNEAKGGSFVTEAREAAQAVRDRVQSKSM